MDLTIYSNEYGVPILTDGKVVVVPTNSAITVHRTKDDPEVYSTSSHTIRAVLNDILKREDEGQALNLALLALDGFLYEATQKIESFNREESSSVRDSYLRTLFYEYTGSHYQAEELNLTSPKSLTTFSQDQEYSVAEIVNGEGKAVLRFLDKEGQVHIQVLSDRPKELILHSPLVERLQMYTKLRLAYGLMRSLGVSFGAINIEVDGKLVSGVNICDEPHVIQQDLISLPSLYTATFLSI